jgi:Arc/MetJ-type ribon-helix-helix transcriptional regulator
MVIVTVSIDEDVLDWLDQLVENGVIKDRSEAVKGGIYSFVKEQLGMTSRQKLREFLKKKQIKPFQDGVEAINDVRSEE